MSAPADTAVLIVPDTCALFDVIRHSVGLANGRSHISQFGRIVELQREGFVRLAIGEMVDIEFGANLEKVQTGAITAAREAIQRLNAMVAAHELLPGRYGATVELPTAPLIDASWASRYVDAWVDVVRTVMDAADKIQTDPQDSVYAMGRSGAGLAPCAKRGRSNHDAVVLATALRLARTRDQRTIFVSSNTDDFCGADGELHSDLVDDFEAAGLEYTSSWGAVLGNVRNSHP